MKAIIYTDGGCSGNQNATNYGGWGAVLTTSNSDSRKEIYGGVCNTSNNKMELTAPIEALKRLKRTNIPVEVYSDSNYVVQGMNEWIEGWKARGWKKSNKKPVENQELWQELDELSSKFEDIKFIKVKAHVGVELNELADRLANKGIKEAIGEVVLP